MDIALYTDRLIIRNLHLADWTSFLAMQQDEHVNQHIRAVETELVIRQKFDQRLVPWFYESGNWLTLVIEAFDTKEFVGLIGFYCQDTESMRAEVGYVISPTMQGKGYATESLQAVIDWGRLQFSIHKFVAVCTSDNICSQKVLLKTGFIQEGSLAKHTNISGKWVDDYLYGLLTHP